MSECVYARCVVGIASSGFCAVVMCVPGPHAWVERVDEGNTSIAAGVLCCGRAVGMTSIDW